MWIKNPDGTVLVPTQTLSGSGTMVEPIVVGQTGDYHVFLNPQTDTTGVGDGARLHGAAGHRP